MNTRSLSTSHLIHLLSLAFFLFVSSTWAGDFWPQWRGPNRDNISPEKGLLDNWKNPPKLIWQTEGLGDGYASLVVANEVVYTVGNHRDRTMDVVALKAKDGKLLWRTSIGKARTGRYGGSRSTPTVDGDRLYALHPEGSLVCLETATGKPVWKRNLADYRGEIPSFGFSESPLVDDDMVLGTPNNPDAAVVALAKKTGKEIWRCAVIFDGQRPKQMKESYSSLVISHGAGVKQYVQSLGVGLIGIHAKSGKQLWSYGRLTNRPCQNISTPIIRGDYVFGVSDFGGGFALLKLARSEKGVKAREVYFKHEKNLESHVDSLLLVGDHIYASGHLPVCVEFLTGRTVWKERGSASGNASILYADGNLYMHYENGLMALVGATPKGYQLKGRFRIPFGAGSESWAHPALSGGRLYVREQGILCCYDLKK